MAHIHATCDNQGIGHIDIEGKGEVLADMMAAAIIEMSKKYTVEEVMESIQIKLLKRLSRGQSKGE